MLIFMLMRLFFILFNASLSGSMPFSGLLQAFLHGLRLDLSMSAYLTVFPLLLWVLSQFVHSKTAGKIFAGYTALMLALVFIISLVDAELYSYWGQKLNAYASSFARFPKEMFSFSSGISWSKLLLFTGVGLIVFRIAYDNITMPIPGMSVEKRWQVPVFFTGFAGLLFLMIRGNIGMSPINQSFAYFSDKPFLNHAAVNSTWNFVATLTDRSEDEAKNPYTFTDEASASAVTDSLYRNAFASTGIQLSRHRQPDIVLIILEGWTADVVEFTGGEKKVTPWLNRRALSSLVYTDYYASGNRTDKGLAAIISAQPALARSSIINKLQKFSDLPALPRSLAGQGYTSTFVYGGESEFANMKAYWINCGYKKIVDINSFGKAVMPESWGVHDDELYRMVLKELNKPGSPRFLTALTLSSHEPYKVPHKSIFAGKDESDRYRNSVHYADQCLGHFLEEAEKQPWYEHTLIIIMPDHGHQQPLARLPYEPARFHTPFLVTGGALNPQLRGIRVSRVSQQTDLAPSLLHQLGIDTRPYSWGSNMFDTLSPGFAAYTYNDGIGFVSGSGSSVYDYEAGKIIMGEGKDSLNLARAGRAFHQAYYNEYLKR